MSIESNYEINVAVKTDKYPDGVHYCKIELGWMMRNEAKEKFAELKKIFGANFKLSLKYWDCVGYRIED